jgi:hypothetical protein
MPPFRQRLKDFVWPNVGPCLLLSQALQRRSVSEVVCNATFAIFLIVVAKLNHFESDSVGVVEVDPTPSRQNTVVHGIRLRQELDTFRFKLLNFDVNIIDKESQVHCPKIVLLDRGVVVIRSVGVFQQFKCRVLAYPQANLSQLRARDSQACCQLFPFKPRTWFIRECRDKNR